MIKDNQIHVAICLDKNYLEPFYALLTSIILNNKNNNIVIHTIASDISETTKAEITSYLNTKNSQIFFYKIDLSIFENLPYNGWSIAMYYRLCIPLILPKNITRVLYLDTDIIVIGDLEELYNVDLSSYPIAAVCDHYGTRSELGICKKGNYFNSGVILINITEWKNQQITHRVVDYIRNNASKIIFPDQDSLNAVLNNNWKKLDIRYNLTYHFVSPILNKKLINLFLKDKVIIHYTTKHKPWKITCDNRLRFLYFKYLKKSPKRVPCFKYRDYSIESANLKEVMLIRLREAYLDNPWISIIWNKIKN
ncbi:glycosyltransferase family 8 protein [Pontibacter sp. MBLB2868]|uniref:glycosyltransferase family 8 protein n=1 Tax=Pontibacter sp. MBLB2868 TaxID=3451555 RepID=UPI003F750934